jgi:endonuclease III
MSSRKYGRVKDLILKMDKDDLVWPWLQDEDGKIIQKLNKKRANKFLLGCILDYQMKAHVAWDNARRFAEEDLNDPDDLWGVIAKFSASQWNAKLQKYKLHRFPQAHERVWRIARAVREKPYYGDARRIWKGKDPEQVKEELEKIRLGEQLTRMAIGALIDTGHLKGRTDVKADIHVRRVLGRILTGDIISEDDATKTTRKMFPRNPWRLDSALFQHGRTICKAKPKCGRCKFSSECVFYELL